MTDQAISNGSGVLSEETKVFLDGIKPQVQKLVEDFAPHLLDIETRWNRLPGIEHDFEVNGRTFRFSIELMPEKVDVEMISEALFGSCDCPESKADREQLELPLNENVH